ncbi:DUF1963 domain-containing protein [Sphingomicrobium sp. XHP0235]|uniref:DUF1963 domain-containing protein n=1 Tax=Sphingomicrobium aquimarinum TaxID=3133971 RepID=UPI0031FEF07A
MFKNLLGLNKKAEVESEDGQPLDPAQSRMQRLAERGQSMAKQEKFAKAPPVPKLAPRPTSAEDDAAPEATDATVTPLHEDAATADPAPSEDNHVHDMLDTLEQELAAPVPRRGPHPALRKARRQAIMFRQHLPPRPNPTQLSFWGGKPLLPADFVWPSFTASDGTTRALSFIGQIDCATIPADAGFHLLPDHGVLAFFMDLHWGAYWQWKVVHHAGFTPDFIEHDPPETLPRAFADPGVWGAAADWPRLLPKWTMDPIVVRAEADAPDPDTPFWPGAIDRDTATAAVADVEAGLPEPQPYVLVRDARGKLELPYATFPHDWNALAVALAHLERAVDDVDLKITKKARKAVTADLADWRRKFERARKAGRPISKTARADFWKMLRAHETFADATLPALVPAGIEAALAAGNGADLPAEALAMIVDRHRFSAGDERMLCAPTFVEMEAEERSPDWLCLLELGANPGLGHHFAEGVYQFWIKPEDLAAADFDAVELSAETY